MSDHRPNPDENEPSPGESILASGSLALGLTLSSIQLTQFDRFQAELLDWNERMNLTAITRPSEVQIRHFLDSLTVLAAIPGASNPAETRRRIVDVGAGAGLPGIPLAIALPRSHVVLVEATQKKCRFLEHAIATIGLNNVEVVCGRAEEVAQEALLRATFDDAVVRALAPLATLVELSVPFLRVGGRLYAMKKLGIDAEIDAARLAVTLVGGRLVSAVIVTVPILDEPRQIVVVEKVKPTPHDYPRRDGLPAKSPLGSKPTRPSGMTKPAQVRG